MSLGSNIVLPNVRHGHAIKGHVTATYRVWLNMRNRCNNPNYEGYSNYGGRGITVCPTWNSFEQFLLDMGEQPAGQILDRRNNNLGYSKENCRWVTALESSQNRSMLFRNTPHGLKGVYYHKTRGYWYVVLIRNKTRIEINTGNDFFEACCVRKSWEARHAGF